MTPCVEVGTDMLSDRDNMLKLLTLSAILGLGLPATGCKGCASEPKAEPPPSAEPAAEPAPAAAPPVAEAAAAEAPAAAPEEVIPADYDGPKSENAAGFKVTTGFADAAGNAVTQPEALAPFSVIATALDNGNHPLGKLDVFQGAEVHAFLVARDLRQAYYANGSGAVAPGADARSVRLQAREGGDHALVLVMRPQGEAVQAIATPVVIKGNLPKVAGPGTHGVPRRMRRPSGDVELRVEPDQPIAGAAVRLSGRRYDAAGADKGAFGLPWAVRCSPGFGRCEVIEGDREGVVALTPEQAGEWVLLLPDDVGQPADAPAPKPNEPRNATVFGLTILPPTAEAKP